MDLNKLLSYSVDSGASDLHLSVGSIPMVRINGTMKPLNMEALKQEDMEKKFAEFEKKKEVHSMKKAALKRFKQLMRRGNASEPMAGAVAISREPVNKLNLVTKSPRTQSSGNKQRHVWSRPSYTEVLPMFTPEEGSVKAGQQSTMCSIM